MQGLIKQYIEKIRQILKMNEKEKKDKKVRVMKAEISKKPIVVMWGILIFSILFGIYNNVTQVNTHTVIETRVIEKEVIDTNNIENFVRDFAKAYHSWKNNKEDFNRRTKTLEDYFTKELQIMNKDAIRSDIPTSSTVKTIDIWKVTKSGENDYDILYSVEQEIIENGNGKTCNSFYSVTVHQDDDGYLVIIKNPTNSSEPQKSDYEPKPKDNDATIESDKINAINEFLNTFFNLYPTANEKEIAYYVKNVALRPINKKDLVFAEIINTVYTQKDDAVQVFVSVKYLDEQTKAVQISQFDLILEKGDNWMIVE